MYQYKLATNKRILLRITDLILSQILSMHSIKLLHVPVSVYSNVDDPLSPYFLFKVSPSLIVFTRIRVFSVTVVSCTLCLWCGIMYVVYMVWYHVRCVYGVVSCTLCLWCGIMYVVYIVWYHVRCVYGVVPCTLCLWCGIMYVVYMVWYHVRCVYGVV